MSNLGAQKRALFKIDQTHPNAHAFIARVQAQMRRTRPHLPRGIPPRKVRRIPLPRSWLTRPRPGVSAKGAVMRRWIREQNIERFRHALSGDLPSEKRSMIETLLAEEMVGDKSEQVEMQVPEPAPGGKSLD